MSLMLAVALALGACATLPPPSTTRPPSLSTRPPPPAALVARLAELARGFDGRVGIAVEDVQDRWIAAYDGDTLYPQQSVSKLWVVLAVFAAADRNALNLSEPILVRREDMSVFNQPIQKVLGDTGYQTTLGDLLGWAICKSDNAADDILMRRVGGPEAVQRELSALGLGAIRSSPPEHLLESKIAGLEWKPEYSFGRTFWTARDQVDPAVRSALLQAYVADPDDGASPRAVVDGLSRLKRGELLSPSSTQRFLQLLAETQTGPMRLKAGLAPGWSIAHKTGTGQDLGDLATGYNDVGLVTGPDGRTYAVAVMIASTRQPIPERQRLMADVTRAVVAQHEARAAAGR